MSLLDLAPWGSAIKAFLKTGKLWLWLAVIAGIGLGCWWGYGHIYAKGYQARVEEEREDYTIALDAAVADARAKWDLAAAAAAASTANEDSIVEKVRVIEKRIPQIVERVVPGECRDLGPDIYGLLVQATRAANGQAASGAADTTEPAGPVS